MSRYCPCKDGQALYLDCQECDNDCEKFYCLIVGTRTFTDYDLFKQVVNHMLIKIDKKDIVIISGGARGTDSLAKQYANENGYKYYEFKADWERYGKSAGYRRNVDMQAYISHFTRRAIIAFWDGESKGTKQNFDIAEKYDNKIVTIKYKELKGYKGN